MNTKREVWSADKYDFLRACDSLDELLSYDNDIEAGQTVYVGEAIPVEPEQLFDSDDLFDQLADRAYDIVGEAAEDYPERFSDDAAKELNDLVHGWMLKHCPPSFFCVRNVRPYKVTPEDLQE